MTTIDHEKAASIARGYGTQYQHPSDEAVCKVFAAYLDALEQCRATAARGDLNERQAKKYRDRAEKLREALVAVEEALGFHEGSATARVEGGSPVVWINAQDFATTLQALRTALAEMDPKVLVVDELADKRVMSIGEAIASGLKSMEQMQCIECGRALTADTAEQRPYVALPGDVVAYSTHCKDECSKDDKIEGDSVRSGARGSLQP